MQERKRAHTIAELSLELCFPRLSDALQRFLFHAIHDDDPQDPNEIPVHLTMAESRFTIQRLLYSMLRVTSAGLGE
jgi:hypothetical protein